MTVSDRSSTSLRSRWQTFLQRYPRGGALLFTRHVNRPAGSLIAASVVDTGITPNMVSVAGSVVHAAAAAVLLVTDRPIGVVPWLLVLVLWQLAFSLDCADGQLARARGTASAFGAWLDIVLDVVTHVLVYGVLAWYVAGTLALDGPTAALFAAAVMGGHLIQLFTSFEHGPLGTEPAVARPPTWLRLAMHARQALDYGAFLCIAALLLPWPPLLAGYLLVSAALHLGAAASQLAVNWHRDAFGR